MRGWSLVAIVSVLLSVGAVSQEPQADRERIKKSELIAALGHFVDLDRGIVLSQRESPGILADLEFLRTPDGFHCIPVGKAALATGEGETPPDTLDSEPRKFPRDGVLKGFVRTTAGNWARIEAKLLNPYGHGNLLITSWLSASPLFREGPTDLLGRWEKEHLHLQWHGARGPYHVRISDGEHKTTLQSDTPSLKVPGLVPGRDYRIEVLAHGRDGSPSLAVERSFRTGPPRTLRAVLELPDRWHSNPTGVNLDTATLDVEQPDLIPFLYGMTSVGGGLQLLGEGREVFDRAQTLPQSGYSPFHDRLDDFKVFAVRTKKGFYGKLFWEPTDGRDLRGGCRLHVAMIQEGGTAFLPPPTAGDHRVLPQGVLLFWDPAPNTEKYLVGLEGVWETPRVTSEPKLLVSGLPNDRWHRLSVTAVVGDATSDPLFIDCATFAEDCRTGEFVLDASGGDGFTFDKGAIETVTRGDPLRVDLTITNSAGGASSLGFAGAMGCAPLPEFGAPPRELETAGVASQHSYDSRDRASKNFLVKTPEGVAAVQVVRTSYPKVNLRYVYRRSTAGGVPKSGTRPVQSLSGEAAATALRLIGELDSRDFFAREQAFESLKKLGPGVLALAEEAMSKASSPEVKTRLALLIREVSNDK